MIDLQDFTRRLVESSLGAGRIVQCDAWASRLRKRRPVSVVVPVYNGIDDLRRLADIEGLWRHADDVLFIDDCSTEPGVGKLLEDAASRHGNVRWLRNDRNLGFVRSVNRGLRERMADSDAVVLNSDALPSPDWLARLIVLAYARDDVGTVSPLSNNASFFSLPVANRPNPQPAGWTPADCSHALAWLARDLYEVSLTTCGFCWYVKQDAIETVGLLDEYLFHRGYAEESDFCLRAEAAGFSNLIALNCYVGHVGGASFGREKRALKRNNAGVLKAIRPDFIERLKAYEDDSCIPGLGEEFGRLTGAGGGEPGAMLVTDVECSPKAGERDAVLGLDVDSDRSVSLMWRGQVASVDIAEDDVRRLQWILKSRFCPENLVERIPTEIEK